VIRKGSGWVAVRMHEMLRGQEGMEEESMMSASGVA
jgi:hypothetical protein